MFYFAEEAEEVVQAWPGAGGFCIAHVSHGYIISYTHIIDVTFLLYIDRNDSYIPAYHMCKAAAVYLILLLYMHCMIKDDSSTAQS